MDELENEVDGMKSRLSHVDELEKKCQIQEENMDKLESKCKALEGKCNSLERSIQILIKEQKWKYAAPSIPKSYWDRPEDIEGMGYLLKQMKDRTVELRSGRNIQQHILLNGGFEGTETVLLYDDILLPHWKELANALQLYQNCGGLLSFSICNVQLTFLVMDLLAQALKGKTIFKKVELERNDFVNTLKGIEFAVKIIEDINLEQLNWVSNEIERIEDARYLINAIISHPRIHYIRLIDCLGEYINGYDVLRSLFTCGKSFSHINLDKNEIRTGGSTAIPDYLATNPPLKYLFLANNHLNDDDAVLIAHALKRNTNLQHLRLSDNDITCIGLTALNNMIPQA